VGGVSWFVCTMKFSPGPDFAIEKVLLDNGSSSAIAKDKIARRTARFGESIYDATEGSRDGSSWGKKYRAEDGCYRGAEAQEDKYLMESK
jgi:hypothetical protein